MGDNDDQIDRMIEAISKKIEEHKDESKYFLMRATYYMKHKKFKEALADTEKALNCKEGDLKIAGKLFMLQAEIYLESTDIPNAEVSIKRAIWAHKEIEKETKEPVIDPKRYVLQGRILMCQKKWNKARELLEAAKSHAHAMKGDSHELQSVIASLLEDCNSLHIS